MATISYQSYGLRWAAAFGAFGGIGAGLIAGAATAVVPDAIFRRIARCGAWAAAISWGGLAAGVMPVRVDIGSVPQGLLWGFAGALAGLAAMPVGWWVGKALSPVVVFFEELAPYLTEMARPLGHSPPASSRSRWSLVGSTARCGD